MRVRSSDCMKAILLAGGKGTRLRPLTVHTPKPIVPIFDRPFLYYQIDLLRQVPEIDEVDSQPQLPAAPHRGDLRRGRGPRHPPPLRRRADAARHRRRDPLCRRLADRVGGRLQRRRADPGRSRRRCCALHRERKAKATIVLTPVENPRAYGLVETDAQRQHPALPREAGRGRDHLQHDQRRHLRARAGDVRSHPEGHARGRSSAASSRR